MILGLSYSKIFKLFDEETPNFENIQKQGFWRNKASIKHLVVYFISYIAKFGLWILKMPLANYSSCVKIIKNINSCCWKCYHIMLWNVKCLARSVRTDFGLNINYTLVRLNSRHAVRSDPGGPIVQWWIKVSKLFYIRHIFQYLTAAFKFNEQILRYQITVENSIFHAFTVTFYRYLRKFSGRNHRCRLFWITTALPEASLATKLSIND